LVRATVNLYFHNGNIKRAVRGAKSTNNLVGNRHIYFAKSLLSIAPATSLTLGCVHLLWLFFYFLIWLYCRRPRRKLWKCFWAQKAKLSEWVVYHSQERAVGKTAKARYRTKSSRSGSIFFCFLFLLHIFQVGRCRGLYL